VNDDSASPFVGWAHPEKPAFGHWIGCVQIDPFNSNRALYVTGATLWGTDNLTALDNHGVVNWAIRAQGIEETAVNDLVSPPVGAHLHSALADIGGFRHDDLNVVSPTGMRHDPRFGSTDSINFAELKPEVMVCSGSGQPRASYTLDGGTTWMPVAAEPAGTKGPGPIALGADGLTMVWSPEGAEPSISTDFGANWTSVDGLRPGVSIVPDRANPSWFYALDSESGCLLVSTDGGHTFLPRTTGLKDSKGLRTVPGRVGDLWLVSAGQVLHSTDAGESFTGLNTVDTAETLGFGKAAPGQDYPAIYLSGTIGVFRSDDTGRTWVRINDDEHQYGSIGHVVIGDPRVYGRVYVATNGRGILYADPAGPSVASASTPPSQSKPAQPADVALAR